MISTTLRKIASETNRMTVKAAEAWWIEKKNVYLTGLLRLAVLSRSSLNIPNKAGRRGEDRINA